MHLFYLLLAKFYCKSFTQYDILYVSNSITASTIPNDQSFKWLTYLLCMIKQEVNLTLSTKQYYLKSERKSKIIR